MYLFLSFVRIIIFFALVMFCFFLVLFLVLVTILLFRLSHKNDLIDLIVNCWKIVLLGNDQINCIIAIIN
jgi:hypothetical protein